MASTIPLPYLSFISPSPPPNQAPSKPISTSSSQLSPPPPPSLVATTTTNTTPIPTQSSWVETLRSHARSNRFQDALSTYVSMTSIGIAPDHFAFPAALKACSGICDLDAGKQLHAAAIKHGYHTSPVSVANTLITMYAKCGDVGSVFKVFDGILERDQVSWNSMVAALCMFKEWEMALEAFRMMLEEENVDPSSFTLVSVALACSNLERRNGLRLGKELHGYGVRSGFYSDGKTFTHNSLIAMYAKLGRVIDSIKLFERFDHKDIVSWNSMISSLVQNELFNEALVLLKGMLLSGVKPDGVTLASVLPACSHLEVLDFGREIHGYAMRSGDLFENTFVASALVDMYCNFGQIAKGHLVFDRVSRRRLGLLNAMISGYAQNGLDDEAVELFVMMEAAEGLVPNATTLTSVLPACVRSDAFSRKDGIHGYVVKRGLEGDKYVQNALMDMYFRVGQMEISRRIFNNMDGKDVVSWNTMITGYIVGNDFSEAFTLLSKMQTSSNAENNPEIAGVKHSRPNNITLMTVLPACATLAAIAKGKEIHGYAIRNNLASDVAVGSALVDMYAKCGCLTLSRRVFDRMPKWNVVTWNVLIMAYGMNGLGEEALKLFQTMVARGEVKPNEVTFIAVFAACSHSGKVNEGIELFHRMKAVHGIEPIPDHYACIVDLLGRAGQLEEAYHLISTMDTGTQQAAAWSSLLGACHLHRHIKLGVIAANHLFQLEPDVASHYVLLSNIYSAAGLWKEAMGVRNRMKEIGVRKEPGCSWIEVGNKVHQFMVGESLHPQSPQLHSFIETLWERMRREGYVPDTSCVLHNVEEDEKEMLLCGHSEKLAIAFGILNTPPGSTIRVAKNLRVCNDCHSATKFISKIEGREIILRDVRRFHHFKNGSCSCGDYW